MIATMGYPGMSADVFQNANISILACQLFVRIQLLAVLILVWTVYAGTRIKTEVKHLPHGGGSAGLSIGQRA